MEPTAGQPPPLTLRGHGALRLHNRMRERPPDEKKFEARNAADDYQIMTARASSWFDCVGSDAD